MFTILIIYVHTYTVIQCIKNTMVSFIEHYKIGKANNSFFRDTHISNVL
jgi:hypothetical protein